MARPGHHSAANSSGVIAMRGVAFRVWMALACLAGLVAPPAARAEVILGPSQLGTDINPYLRFAGGFPTTASSTQNNPTFYLQNLDFSGVGWRLPGIFGSAAWN